MLFTDIHLQNYRSYGEASFELGSGVNIVVGPNAAGKTNLLEALMVAAIGRSYRSKDNLLIKDSEPWLRIDVHTANNQTRVIKMVRKTGDKVEKSFEFDGKSYKRLTIAHRQPVVLFQPEDMRLLNAEPQLRREYFDDLIEQYSPGYAQLRANLRRVVAQRNALLKQQTIGQSQLFAWNLRLSDIASKVVERRVELIDTLNEKLAEIYAAISGKQLDLCIQYYSKTSLGNYAGELMSQLEQQTDIDRVRGYTTRGPHRDDFLVMADERLLSNSASRGENRTLMLVLKILELQTLEEKTGIRPLLLLDDVFSELDGYRRRSLTSFLHNYQTLITTTDADIVTENFSEKTHKISI